MTPKDPRTNECSASERAGRIAQAEGFWNDAGDLHTLGGARPNTLVTLYVHAGIAAADAICCARPGEYSNSTNHSDAVALLRRADPALTAPLQRLVSMKSAAGYGAAPISAQRVTDAQNAATKLMNAVRLL